MREAAQAWWQEIRLHAQRLRQWNNWDAFKIALITHFQPPNYQQSLRDQLKVLKQKGSVRDYTTIFRNIIGQVTGMGEQNKVGYYTDGLKQVIKIEVKYRKPQNLPEVIKMATEYDFVM